jgi:hypothetical protein
MPEPRTFRDEPVSFVRRSGRMSEAQDRAFIDLAPHYLLDVPRDVAWTSVHPEARLDPAVEYGRDKLVRKGLDAVVVNDVSVPGIGFDATDNEVTLVTAAGDEPVPRGTKAEIARAILATVDRLRAAQAKTAP